eukprot:scaffold1778_cov246-Pinguiococcus_pyrenoidosus.AAC.1
MSMVVPFQPCVAGTDTPTRKQGEAEYHGMWRLRDSAMLHNSFRTVFALLPSAKILQQPGAVRRDSKNATSTKSEALSAKQRERRNASRRRWQAGLHKQRSLLGAMK